MRSVSTAPTRQSRSAASRPRTRRRWLWMLGGAAVLLAVWSAVVAFVLLDARGELTAARAEAGNGVRALTEGEIEAAQNHLASADAAFRRGGMGLHNPLLYPVRVLPIAGRNLRTATALADAGALVAGAGRDVAAAVTGLPGGVEALAPRDAALPVDALAAIGPSVTAARQRVDEARALLAEAPAENLLAPVADARAELDAELTRAGDALSVGEPLIRALPAFLGHDGPRRYFFGAAQPAELRGSTGFIGAYAILTLDQGRFSFSPFSAIQDLPVTPAGTVEPPNPDFLARYGDLGGTGFWQNLNVSPDFPTTGVAVERLWQHTFGEPLDGTISADPFALAALLRLAGPVDVPGIGVVDADGVVPFVANEAYGQFTDPEQRKRLLGDVAAAAFTGFLGAGLSGGPEGTLDALRALGDAAGDGHVVIHAADPDVQAAFEAGGIAGRLLEPPGDYFAAFVTGASGSKIDYYLDRELHYQVDLEPEGRASTTATLRLRNDAPTSGPPAYIIGPNTERVVAGENEIYVAAYVASSAEVINAEVDGAPAAGQLQHELGHPLVETFEELPSGAGRELRYTVATSQAWFPEGEGGRYLLTIQEQATIRPNRATLEVRVPDGMVVVAADDPWTVEDGVARFSGELRGTLSAEIEFAPPPERVSLVERIRRWLGEPLAAIGE